MNKPKKVKVKNLHFQVIFRAEPEGGFTAIVPALPGCVSFGKNLEQARKMVKEAITLYLEDMASEGESISKTDNSYIGNVEVEFPVKRRASINV